MTVQLAQKLTVFCKKKTSGFRIPLSALPPFPRTSCRQYHSQNPTWKPSSWAPYAWTPATWTPLGLDITTPRADSVWLLVCNICPLYEYFTVQNSYYCYCMHNAHCTVFFYLCLKLCCCESQGENRIYFSTGHAEGVNTRREGVKESS